MQLRKHHNMTVLVTAALVSCLYLSAVVTRGIQATVYGPIHPLSTTAPVVLRAANGGNFAGAVVGGHERFGWVAATAPGTVNQTIGTEQRGWRLGSPVNAELEVIFNDPTLCTIWASIRFGAPDGGGVSAIARVSAFNQNEQLIDETDAIHAVQGVGETGQELKVKFGGLRQTCLRKLVVGAVNELGFSWAWLGSLRFEAQDINTFAGSTGIFVPTPQADDDDLKDWHLAVIVLLAVALVTLPLVLCARAKLAIFGDDRALIARDRHAQEPWATPSSRGGKHSIYMRGGSVPASPASEMNLSSIEMSRVGRHRHDDTLFMEESGPQKTDALFDPHLDAEYFRRQYGTTDGTAVGFTQRRGTAASAYDSPDSKRRRVASPSSGRREGMERGSPSNFTQWLDRPESRHPPTRGLDYDSGVLEADSASSVRRPHAQHRLGGGAQGQGAGRFHIHYF